MSPIYIIFAILSIIIIVLCVIVYNIFKPENEKQFIAGFSDKPQQTQNIELFNDSKKCKYLGCNNDNINSELNPGACKKCINGVILSNK